MNSSVPETEKTCLLYIFFFVVIIIFAIMRIFVSKGMKNSYVELNLKDKY